MNSNNASKPTGKGAVRHIGKPPEPNDYLLEAILDLAEHAGNAQTG